MNTLLLVLMLAVLVATLERTHRRGGSLWPRPFDGEALSTDNRDLSRTRQELVAGDAGAGRRPPEGPRPAGASEVCCPPPAGTA
ncbi:MAG TPA: hypothetical protein VHM65_07555 [Candidatus Lustribacter sp.]|nr:hypothetical protein [Candidatus Lustribacter sp.]